MSRVVLSILFELATVAMPVSAQVPGGCNTPVGERTSDVGCYLDATELLGELPQALLFWHLYTYPTRAAADAAKGPRGTVVESFEKVWLYAIAEASWRPSSGARVAVVGPLQTVAGKQYTARYMEARYVSALDDFHERMDTEGLVS